MTQTKPTSQRIDDPSKACPCRLAGNGLHDGMTDVPPLVQTRWRIAAPAEAAGQRADRFLAEAIGVLSRSRIKGLIEQGRAKRDGVIFSQPAEPIRAGAIYELEPPPLVSAVPQPQAIAFHILFEDSDLLVLDKPAGLVVHPAPGHEDGTLVNALLAHCGDSLPGIGGERRPGIVHRLDRDTTGVMVVAKSEQALAALSALFAARDLERTYVALVWGVPSPSPGEIEGAIGRDPRDRKRMAIVARGGKAALTRYRVTRAFGLGASLLQVQLATGRTHQIRVHLASLGHPVVGDPLYIRRVPAASRLLEEPARGELLDFPRQALHASTLGFRHPRSGKSMFFETPIPPDFASLIESIS
jgi:23S rRNA pseudouridine1911/1915/1917 synthase